MVKLKIYDAFETKADAEQQAKTLREDGVEFVRIRKVSQDSGRLKYGIYLGGKRSSIYV